VSEVIAGELGYIEGVDSNGGQPGIKNMSSDRWASILKHQRLLNPHLLLRDILAAPNQAVESGEVLFEGSVHHLLVVEGEVAPMTLYINAGTGRVAKLTTMESDNLRRDVPLEVFYYSWQPVGEGGLFFPAEVYVAYDGEIVQKEIRTTIAVNPELEATLFEFPAEAAPTFDEAVATRGAAFHQYHQNHAALGFPRDAVQTVVTGTEVMPGIFHVTGSQHHSLVVEQAEGIVVLEAPFDEIRSQVVIDWIKTTFPDKPISHVVSSHHHVDHSAGLRTYVAEGATVVMGEAARLFFEEKVFSASSTLIPDALSENPVAATIEAVPADGSFTLPDETQPVEVYPIGGNHAEDMVISYLPEAGLVFVSDLYSPNPNATANPGAGAATLRDRITELGLDVTTIVGGHGGIITFEDFEALLAL
jgi:glyoxylase-like metal-dependent hydrolase (beta-lactamase superfamily II)